MNNTLNINNNYVNMIEDMNSIYNEIMPIYVLIILIIGMLYFIFMFNMHDSFRKKFIEYFLLLLFILFIIVGGLLYFLGVVFITKILWMFCPIIAIIFLILIFSSKN